VTKSPILLSVAAVLLTACQASDKSAADNGANGAATVDAAADETAIRAQVTRWMELVKAKDAAAITQLYTEDGAVMPPNEPIGKGRDAIQKTWTSLVGNLPAESINVVSEDPKDARILYLGTDTGVFASVDQGRTWHALCANLPTIPVHDLVVHPRESELVIATHGRSLFVADISPVRAVK